MIVYVGNMMEINLMVDGSSGKVKFKFTRTELINIASVKLIG